MANDPYFVNPPEEAKVNTIRVKNPPLKITRAAGGSRGKDLRVEEVTDPDSDANLDWAGGLGQVRESEYKAIFAKFASKFGGGFSESSFPMESYMGDSLSPAEEERILRIAKEEETRVRQDPVTKVPSNWAAVDRTPESDSFFGKDKDLQDTEKVLERQHQNERGREKVNYQKSESIPIKLVQRR